MQLKHLNSLTQPSQGIVKVTAICWAPNGKKLAICTTDRLVIMFDENGERKDKFSTKPAEKVILIWCEMYSARLCIIHLINFLNLGSQKLHREANGFLSPIRPIGNCAIRQYGVCVQDWA